MSNAQPIIVVKKKGGHHGHHGGAWKVAYADFVTAMMAFFLVMWLVGQSPQVRAGVGGYFRDPVAFEQTGGRGILPGGDTVEEPKPVTPPETDSERERLQAAVLHIKEGLDQTALASLRDQVEFSASPEGLRIDLVERDESTFFDSGSAKLRGGTDQVLGVIAKELGAINYKLDLEGHTDSRGYASEDRYSNWELSADRANAARRVMEKSGLRIDQVTSVRGLADRQLRYPNDPFDARNRRVSILVKSPALSTSVDVKPTRDAAPAPADAGQPTAAKAPPAPTH
jgi:chemotaxis protein MotB